MPGKKLRENPPDRAAVLSVGAAKNHDLCARRAIDLPPEDAVAPVVHVKPRDQALRARWRPDLVQVGQGSFVLLEGANSTREQRSALLFGGSRFVEVVVPAHSRAGGPRLF